MKKAVRKRMDRDFIRRWGAADHIDCFDALLEIAQALVNDPDANGLSYRTEEAIASLDAKWPGWREWKQPTHATPHAPPPRGSSGDT